MIKRRIVFGLMVVVTLTLTVSARRQEQKQSVTQAEKGGGHESSAETKAQGTSPKYIPVQKYDPSRNAEQDLRDAMTEARRTGMRILLVVGGDWCIWCHIMDEFIARNADLLALSAKNFVTLKINFSEQNPNAQLLSRYPAINGYPHIFVLDREGKLLWSQDTAALEDRKTYDLGRFMSFLKAWSPAPRVEALR